MIGKNLLDDTTIAMAGGVIMFLVPVNLSEQKFLLDWSDMKELPWVFCCCLVADCVSRTGWRSPAWYR